jgi:hypothetical protein
MCEAQSSSITSGILPDRSYVVFSTIPDRKAWDFDYVPGVRNYAVWSQLFNETISTIKRADLDQIVDSVDRMLKLKRIDQRSQRFDKGAIGYHVLLPDRDSRECNIEDDLHKSWQEYKDFMNLVRLSMPCVSVCPNIGLYVRILDGIGLDESYYLDWDTHLARRLLFRGPSNQKYTINKQQTNKHTTLLIVMISDKCSIMQCSVLLVAVVGLLHSSLLVVAGWCREKNARNTITGIGPSSIP